MENLLEGINKFPTVTHVQESKDGCTEVSEVKASAIDVAKGLDLRDTSGHNSGNLNKNVRDGVGGASIALQAAYIMSTTLNRNKERRPTQLPTVGLNVGGGIVKDNDHGLDRSIVAGTRQSETRGVNWAVGGCSSNKAGSSQDEGRDKREDAHCERVVKSDGCGCRKTGVKRRRRDGNSEGRTSRLGVAFYTPLSIGA